MATEECAMQWQDNARGFSLLEAVVAIGLLAGALAVLLQLFAITTRANQSARVSSLATIAAGAKMEELRRLAPPYTASPSDALITNRPGFCDLLDAGGSHLADCVLPGDRAFFVRRWAVAPLAAGPGNTTALTVLVSWGDMPDATPASQQRLEQVRLVSVRAAGHR
jgi:type II secretory pathway pseudopilin PulG